MLTSLQFLQSTLEQQSPTNDNLRSREQDWRPEFDFKCYRDTIKWKINKRMRKEIEKQPKYEMDKRRNMSQNKAFRKSRKIELCPHTDLQHYAKGMCKQCYTLNGRQKLATKCVHTDKQDYARGLCHPCYCSWYNVNVRRAKSRVVNAPI